MSGAADAQPKVSWPPAGSQPGVGHAPTAAVGEVRPSAPGPQQGPAKRLCVAMKEAHAGQMGTHDELMTAIRQLYELRSQDIKVWKGATEAFADHACKLDLLMDADLQ